MEEKKTYLDQNRAPIYEALQRFREMRVVPFDVPGHKHGRGNPELTAFLGSPWITCVIPFRLSGRRRSWRRRPSALPQPF